MLSLLFFRVNTCITQSPAILQSTLQRSTASGRHDPNQTTILFLVLTEFAKKNNTNVLSMLDMNNIGSTGEKKYLVSATKEASADQSTSSSLRMFTTEAKSTSSKTERSDHWIAKDKPSIHEQSSASIDITLTASYSKLLVLAPQMPPQTLIHHIWWVKKPDS